MPASINKGDVIKYVFALIISLNILPQANTNTCSLLFTNKSDSLTESEYKDLSVTGKINYIMTRVKKTQYSQYPVNQQFSLKNLLQGIRIILTGGLAETFSHESDFMPEGKIKIIHTYGSVAKVKFIPSIQKYTGIFEGAEGLLRFSLAAPLKAGFIPGMALLFPIQGQLSQTIIAMYSVDGQTSQNFFEHPFTNRIPKAAKLGTKLGSLLFSLIKKDPNILELNSAASILQSGEEVREPVTPFKIIFKPTESVNKAYDSNLDFRDSLAQIPTSTVLYEVYAQENISSPEKHIGSLELQSQLIASEFGDQNLFFRHVR